MNENMPPEHDKLKLSGLIYLLRLEPSRRGLAPGPSTVADASSSASARTAFSVSLLSCSSVQSSGTGRPSCFS